MLTLKQEQSLSHVLQLRGLRLGHLVATLLNLRLDDGEQTHRCGLPKLSEVAQNSTSSSTHLGCLCNQVGNSFVVSSRSSSSDKLRHSEYANVVVSILKSTQSVVSHLVYELLIRHVCESVLDLGQVLL